LTLEKKPISKVEGAGGKEKEKNSLTVINVPHGPTFRGGRGKEKTDNLLKASLGNYHREVWGISKRKLAWRATELKLR